MKLKTMSVGIALGAAFACSGALAQSSVARAHARPNAIVVSGTSTVPSAVVVVTRNEPRPATAPTADTRGPVEPRINPPG